MKKHLSTQTRKRMLSSIGLILFSVSFVLAQVLVKGTVKDNLGEGVPGASVQVKGTSQGTITDLDGKFAFNVPNKNSILVISFIGYVTVEMKVDTQKPMVITLKEDTKTLDEVVVVGYQEIRKKDLTGSVAKASMAELLSTPTASFGETLGGRIAGVNVSSGEGMPGGQMNIVIRGNNSLTQDNSPLYVIDGFPVEDPSIAAAINQNDIESLDFLKDASATAIYGARGANGVVMITTKKGTIGQPKIKYDGSFGIQHITKTIPMMDAYEFVKLQAERSPKDMETTEKMMAEPNSPVLGLHLEGHYFNMAMAGGQIPENIKDPDPEEYIPLLEETHCIKRWDAAPELPGAMQFGKYITAKGVLASVGHTQAEFEDIQTAYEAGYTHATHFYNAMPGFHKRKEYKYEGTVESIYLIDDMTVEVVADGIHVPPTILRLVYKIKGVERTCLITDALACAASDSQVAFDPRVIIEDGVCKLADHSALAGSIATMDRLIRTMVQKAEIPLEDAVRMASETPARIMGVLDRKGTLERGKDADIIALDRDLNVRAVWAMGELVEGTNKLF